MMDVERPVGAGPAVALVCPERRLRLVLRLALEAAGYRVLDWSRLPPAAEVGAPAVVVADLDSWGARPTKAAARLHGQGVPATIPLLLISVYPAERDGAPAETPTEYLQPPFAPREFVRRVEHLLAARAPAAEHRSPPPS